MSDSDPPVDVIVARTPGERTIRVTKEGAQSASIQANGYTGHDLNVGDVSADTIHRLTRAPWMVVTTSYFPTMTTAPAKKILHAMNTTAAAVRDDTLVANCVADVHVEGSYLRLWTVCAASTILHTYLMRSRWSSNNGWRVPMGCST